MSNESKLDAKQLQEELAKKYKNPKNVEHFGVEAIPPELKTTKWYDLFMIFASFFITPVHMMLPGTFALIYGLSFWQAVISTTLGTMIAYVFEAIFAMTGTKYGLPGAVATRFTMGGTLARFIPSVLRAITSIILFAAQTLGGGLAIQALLREATGNTYHLLIISFLFAIFQTIIAIMGFEGLKKLTRFVFPLKLLGMGYIAYSLIYSGIPEFAWDAVTKAPPATPGWSGFAIATSIMMGIFLTLITDTSDFCRYTRSNPDMFFGTIVGTGVSQFIASFMGVYSALAISNWNVFEAMTHTHPSLIVIIFLIIMVVLDNWSVNILNLYTAGLCLVNSVPKLGRFWWTVIAGVLATIACTQPVFIDHATPIIDKFGLVYSPIAGILMADLIFLKKFKMDMSELMKPDGRYSYYKGWNPIAILVIVIGAIVFSFWPDVMVPVLSNIIFTGILYYLLVKVISPHWKGLRIASTPYEEEVKTSKENGVAG